MHKACHSIKEVPYCFLRSSIHQISRSHVLKNRWFKSNLSKITRPVAAIKSLRFALLKQYQDSLFIQMWWKNGFDHFDRIFTFLKSSCASHLIPQTSQYHFHWWPDPWHHLVDRKHDIPCRRHINYLLWEWISIICILWVLWYST